MSPVKISQSVQNNKKKAQINQIPQASTKLVHHNNTIKSSKIQIINNGIDFTRIITSSVKKNAV